MPAFAIATAGSIFVGQAIGAKAHEDVPRTVWLTLRTAASWQGLVGLLYLAAPALLISVFTRDDADGRALLEVGTRILMLSVAWQLFDAASMSFAEALRAAGDTAFTFWARAAVAWGVFAPGAWISVRVYGGSDVVAVAWLAVYLALLALVLWLRFRTGKWRTMELTGAH
jgi:MATE family multidrug resistance protein